MGEIQQEYICSVTKCTSCCSQLLYHNKDRLVSHSMKVFTQRNRDFPANVECLTTIMLLRRSPSALSHHQSPGWECGHVLARLVGQGHLVLDLPAGRWLPSIVQMLSWKETDLGWTSQELVYLRVAWSYSRMLYHLHRKWHLDTRAKNVLSLLPSLWPEGQADHTTQQSQDSKPLKFPLGFFSTSPHL